MKTTERERDALVGALHGTGELAAIAADQVLVITRNATDESLLLLMPGARTWTSLTAFLERCTTAEDNGRAALLEVWPGCPADFQDKILAVISIAPSLVGAA
jgi:hypothetical protein